MSFAYDRGVGGGAAFGAGGPASVSTPSRTPLNDYREEAGTPGMGMFSGVIATTAVDSSTAGGGHLGTRAGAADAARKTVQWDSNVTPVTRVALKRHHQRRDASRDERERADEFIRRHPRLPLGARGRQVVRCRRR